MKFSNLKSLSPILVLPALLSISACSDDTDYDFDASLLQAQEAAAAAVPAEALFEAPSILPSPNNLAFVNQADGTLSPDGTLQITIPEDASPSDPRRFMNTLDGFSTIEPSVTTFSQAIAPESLVIGQSVRVFETTVDPATGGVTGVTSELTAADIVATAAGDGTTLAISPIRPLKESTTFMYIVTSGVTNTAGIPSSPSTHFRLVSGQTPLSGEAAPLEPIRLATSPLVQLAQEQGIPRGSIILAWAMRTQSITPVLRTISEQVVAANASVSSQSSPTPGGLADLRAGTIELPYYRTAPASINDETGASSFWTGPGGSFLTAFNQTPLVTSTQTVPLLLSIPNATAQPNGMPDSGWPVALFVHGITQNRTNMVAVADRMAVDGFAVIAIDLPMHGITDTEDPLFLGSLERTFNLDLINNDSRQPGPDELTDPSGTHFYSPAFLLASRDNLRQSAADLLVLSASIGSITAGDDFLNADNKTLIGHSLGGTVATTFLAFDTTIKAATLGMPAAGLARMLIASPAFGPLLIAGLEQNELIQGTPDFDSFLLGAQTVIDSGDAINFAEMAAANTPIHMIEVIGDGGDNLPDQTVPNNVEGVPLAGTDPLARLMNLSPVSVTTDGPGLVRFTQGAHSSLINPGPDAAAFSEMQNEMAIFSANSGTRLQIDNEAIVSSE